MPSFEPMADPRTGPMSNTELDNLAVMIRDILMAHRWTPEDMAEFVALLERRKLLAHIGHQRSAWRVTLTSRLVAHLDENPTEFFRADELAAVFGKHPDSMRALLSRLQRERRVLRLDTGAYASLNYRPIEIGIHAGELPKEGHMSADTG